MPAMEATMDCVELTGSCGTAQHSTARSVRKFIATWPQSSHLKSPAEAHCLGILSHILSYQPLTLALLDCC